MRATPTQEVESTYPAAYGQAVEDYAAALASYTPQAGVKVKSSEKDRSRNTESRDKAGSAGDVAKVGGDAASKAQSRIELMKLKHEQKMEMLKQKQKARAEEIAAKAVSEARDQSSQVKGPTGIDAQSAESVAKDRDMWKSEYEQLKDTRRREREMNEDRQLDRLRRGVTSSSGGSSQQSLQSGYSVTYGHEDRLRTTGRR